MIKKYDVIVIGGGPGGSNTATILAQKSLSVALFEREAYPRFHIGESLLPASMPILKETGFYETLSSGKYIEKYGARFVDHKTDDEVYFGFRDGLNPNIPMAFEVERKDFDRDLLEHARKSGVDVYQPERVKEVEFFENHVSVITNRGNYEAKFLVDSSGRDAMLGKQMKVRHVNNDLNNVAVFAHFHGVKRLEGKNEGDILIGLLPDRGWNWIIPFKGERTSVGAVCSSSIFSPGTDMGAYLESTLSRSPRVRDYMKNAERATEVTVISNYSHTCERLSGDRWILVGDAAVFLDPIFSSGVHVALSSGKFAAETIFKAHKEDVTLSVGNLGTQYQIDLLKGVKRFHALISMFYEGSFVANMKKTATLKNTLQGFTSAVAGDMWDDENILFRQNVL